VLCDPVGAVRGSFWRVMRTDEKTLPRLWVEREARSLMVIGLVIPLLLASSAILIPGLWRLVG
jgi:hypothetical protein